MMRKSYLEGKVKRVYVISLGSASLFISETLPVMNGATNSPRYVTLPHWCCGELRNDFNCQFGGSL